MIRQRVISAIFIVACLLLVVLVVPASWSAAALSLVLLAAAWEWSGFCLRGAAARAGYVAAAVALGAAAWQVSASSAGLAALLWLALALWTGLTVWVFALPARVSGIAVALCGLLVLPLAWMALVRMRLDWQEGQHAVMYALLIVWVADSGAYFAGRAFGRRKLAPTVSPGKTWAGLWGGFAACAALALLVAAWRGLPWPALLGVTLVVALFSVVGDLAESLCKRFAGLKDSGSLIPGHGGVLDRFDSLLAAAPLLMLGITLVPELRA